MSSKKYVLDPSGKIKEIRSNGDVNDIDAINVTDQYMQQQGDFFGDRADFAAGAAKIPATNFLPSGIKGLAAAGADLIGGNLSNNLKETGIIAREKPVKTDGFFPDSNRDTLLINPSFGADEDTKYYKNFNTAFSEFNANKNIFAEELEMVAGIEFNSFGLVSVKGLDITKLLFVFDYILESAAYIATAITLLEVSNENSLLKKSPIARYFHDILQFNYKDYEKNNKKTLLDISQVFSCFYIGLNQFLNTDPKIPDLLNLKVKEAIKFDFLNFDPLLNLANLLQNIVLSSSKIGDNRLFLLIRKFQQESYWHSEILYKAKNDTVYGTGIGISAENLIDKFFSEFSQYYFKFIVERINIGHAISAIDLSRDRKRVSNLGPKRIAGYRNDGVIFDTSEALTSESESGYVYSAYKWDSKKTIDSSFGLGKASSLSNLSLPQLLKGYDYDIHRMKNDKIRQNFKSSKDKRLPAELVKKIENHLEIEYMPFYFHDLRTNEILAFHAFIDTISDSFSPQYNPIKGYGRIDAVQHYTDTTRTISTTFKLVAFNTDDHDMMWYQINKLVSMVYPQWSQGIKSIREGVDKDFRFPFTQVPTASPLIRLRIGDLIKSNYSISSLARLHGDRKILTKKPAKPAETKLINKKAYKVTKKITNGFKVDYSNGNYDEIESYLKKVGFYISLKTEVDSGLLESPVATKVFSIDPKKSKLTTEILKKFGPIPDGVAIIPLLDYVFLDEDVIVTSSEMDTHFYTVMQDTMLNYYVPRSVVEEITVTEKAVTPATKEKFVVKSKLDHVVIKSTGDQGKINNPFTKAYETSRGRGLAGFITNLDFNYNEIPWDTEKRGGKAPMMTTVTISFAPIHDIPPGIDHEGIMRAPVYNTGHINNKIFGDVYDEKDINDSRKSLNEQIEKLTKQIK